MLINIRTNILRPLHQILISLKAQFQQFQMQTSHFSNENFKLAQKKFSEKSFLLHVQPQKTVSLMMVEKRFERIT
jgi:hypothetical protein